MPAKKILILTLKTGAGHMSLANALHDLLLGGCPHLDQGYNIEICDPEPRYLGKHYRAITRNAMWLWRAEYSFFNNPPGARAGHLLYVLLFGRALPRILQRMQPDLIISTHPLLTRSVMRAIERTKRRIPFVMLFTDPVNMHQAFFTEKGAEATLATTRENYTEALAHGFDPQRVYCTGWPVRQQFYQYYKREDILARLGLRRDRFTVFLQAGGEGAIRIERIAGNILQAGDGVQIILAAGTNEPLVQAYREVPQVRVLPFTVTIAPYMAAADVVMGKAGPNMLFEAVTLNKPFIATSFIAGQEAENLKFIRQYKLGLVAGQKDDQQELLADLMTGRIHIESIAAAVEAYRTWNTAATRSIIPIIQNLLH